MKLLTLLSGEWTGCWTQDGVRHEMTACLEFGSVSATGAGWDTVGSFTLQGTASENGVVRLVKRYQTHEVLYRGVWDGDTITGSWAIRSGQSVTTGEFSFWPQSAEPRIRHLRTACLAS